MKLPSALTHLIFSLIKSLLRIGAGFTCLFTKNVVYLAYGLIAAEIVGILEELY